jgi:predicted permease
MTWLRTLQTRLRSLFAKRQFNVEMDEEMRAHVELLTQEHIAKGLSPKAARCAALRQFGPLDEIKETCREQREGVVCRQWSVVSRDLCFAARMMRRNAGSTLVIVLTLGLAIGVCSTLFTAVNYQLFQPLPIEAPERLVRLWRSNERGERGELMNAARFAEYQRQSRSFAGITGLNSQNMTLTGRGEPRHLSAARVSPNFFEVFGIKLMLGRGFNARSDVDSQAHHAVIDFATWREVFNSSSNALGATLILNQQAYTVIGVLPKDLGRVEVAWGRDVCVPWNFTRPDESNEWFHAVGRLKPGVMMEQARAELRVLGEAIEGANDPSGVYDRATVVPYVQSHVQMDEIMATVFFFMTVGFVLLIACGNVMNVLIARALTRRRELAVRLSLGASRGRLVRQLLSEFVALAILGGVLGLVFAKWTSDLLATRGLAGRPFDTAFDWRVIVFTAGLALFAGLISGLAPALKFSKANLTDALKEGGLTTSFGRGHHRLRNGLVIAQVAMVLVLLVTSGLMIRSFIELGRADPGYDTRNLAMISVNLSEQEYPDQAAQRTFVQQALDNLRAVPGVKKVGLTSLDSVARDIGTFPFRIQGRAIEGNRSPGAAINSVDANFFELVNARVLKGKTFSEADTRSGAGVVVVNETLVNRYFKGEEPLGRFVEMRGGDKPRLYEIVGVVADLKNISFEEKPFAELFVPYTQAARFWLNLRFLVRTETSPRVMAEPLREALLSINRRQPVGNVNPVESQILQLRNWNAEIRYLMWFFGALGFALSMIGIYGVVSYTVTERTRELGVRIALGAVGRDVLFLVFRQSLRLVAIGGAIGIGLSLASTSVLAELLYGVSPLDPVTYLAVFAVVSAATLLASFVPARRAARIEPMTALRTE